MNSCRKILLKGVSSTSYCSRLSLIKHTDRCTKSGCGRFISACGVAENISTRYVARGLSGSAHQLQKNEGTDDGAKIIDDTKPLETHEGTDDSAKIIDDTKPLETHQAPLFVDEEAAGKEEQREEEEHEHSVRQRVLAAALTNVPIYGWSRGALEQGASSEGLPAVAQGMFPRGGIELVEYFYSESNKQLGQVLKQKVEEAEAQGLKLSKTALIRDAIEARLRMIHPYIDYWPQAMGLQTLPPNAVASWSNLLNMTDEVWWHAGDRSTDFNWYSKRLAVAGVYKATEVFMLQDNSHDYQDTWAFLDRRLEDVAALGSARQSCQKNSGVLKESAKGLFIMGRNILGMSSRNK